VWHMLDHALSPLSMPLAFGFTLMFVGRRTQLRRLLDASWVVALAAGAPALFSLVKELGPLAAWGARFTDSDAWYWVNLGHLVVVALIGVWLLIQHARHAPLSERVQARGVLAAMGVLVVLGLTEFLPGPGLGLAGFVIFTLVLALVVLGPGFTEFHIPPRLVPTTSRTRSQRSRAHPSTSWRSCAGEGASKSRKSSSGFCTPRPSDWRRSSAITGNSGEPSLPRSHSISIRW